MKGVRPWAASFVLALLLAALPARSEAWPRGKGKLFAHLGATTFSADTKFDASGTRVALPGSGWEEKDDILSLELGLTDELTFLGTLPLKKETVKGVGDDFTTKGLADLGLGLRYSRPLGHGLVVGLDAGVLLPLGYDAKDFPNLGTGETDALVSGSFGASLPFLPQGIASVDLGYRWRGGRLSDEIPYAVKVGAFPHPRIGVFAFGRGWKSRADFSTVDPFVGAVTDSERLNAGVEVYVKAGKLFDVNGSWSRVVAGKNTPTGDQFLLGVAFHTRLF